LNGNSEIVKNQEVRGNYRIEDSCIKAMTSTPLSFRPSGEIFKGAGNIRTSQDSSLCSEWQWREHCKIFVSKKPLKVCYDKGFMAFVQALFK